MSFLGARQQLQTGLVVDSASVDTVEHLLSALRGLGIDNASVELNHPEVPIMDGSAAPWVYLIQDAGIKELATPRRTIEILRPVQVQHGDKRIAVYPAEQFKVSYTISFDHPMLRHQQKTIDLDEQVFINEIAPARTFGFLKEVEMLRQRGLALGGSLENAVVLGETGVLNPLRFADEFVRHKILDVIGDLALIGHPIQGHLVVHRGGHALHTAFAAELMRQSDAWRFIEGAAPAAWRSGRQPRPGDPVARTDATGGQVPSSARLFLCAGRAPFHQHHLIHFEARKVQQQTLGEIAAQFALVELPDDVRKLPVHVLVAVGQAVAANQVAEQRLDAPPASRSRPRDSMGVPDVVVIVRMASLRSSQGPTPGRRGLRGSCAPPSSSAWSRPASARLRA